MSEAMTPEEVEFMCVRCEKKCGGIVKNDPVVVRAVVSLDHWKRCAMGGRGIYGDLKKKQLWIKRRIEVAFVSGYVAGWRQIHGKEFSITSRMLDLIRQDNDIVDLVSGYVELQRAGAAYKGKCPFHKDQGRSFHINQLRQVFHCFECGAGGDVFAFVMMQKGVDFRGAVEFLLQKGVKR
jgi:hypothetical protein